MRESITRLIHSFVVCHIAYVAAFHNWYRQDEDNINVLIRRVYKIAVGLPESTGTERLLQLDIHSTLKEIAEAQRTPQLERLSGTNADRHILENLGIGYHTQQGHKVTVPDTIQHIVDPNIETFTRRRWEARAKAPLNAHGNDLGTRFVDAAKRERGSRFAVTVVDSDGATKISASVACEHAEEAEEIAVPLAPTEPACKTILCDSRQAIRNFAKESLVPRAAWILSRREVHRELEPKTSSGSPHTWGTTGASENQCNGNETAHARARELTNRAGDDRPWYSTEGRMTSYNEITNAFRSARRTFPSPSEKLDRSQAVALRQLKTRTYSNPAQYHKMYPEVYPTNTCKVYRNCTKDPRCANSWILPPRLSAALCRPCHDTISAVQHDCEAVKRQDYDAPKRAKRISGDAPKRVT